MADKASEAGAPPQTPLELTDDLLRAFTLTHPAGSWLHRFAAEILRLRQKFLTQAICARCGSTDRALDLDFHCSTCWRNALSRIVRLEAETARSK